MKTEQSRRFVRWRRRSPDAQPPLPAAPAGVAVAVEDPAARPVPSSALVVLPRRRVLPRSPAITIDHPTFNPPFLGSHVVARVLLEEIVGYVDEETLFRSHWRIEQSRGESEKEFKRRARRALADRLGAAGRQELILPQVAYGYFPANSEGDEVIIWQDVTRTIERLRIGFARQGGGQRLCVADYVKPVGEPDYVALQVATVGGRVDRLSCVLYSGQARQDCERLRSLGIVVRDALTEYWHRRIRIEWGIAVEDGPSLNLLFSQCYRGGRYPLAGNEAAVANLLEADRIGVSVGRDGLLQPGLTTAVLIVHHPQA
jgi:5-methyltetrahydrofolate--homocysteine methyltransferase